MLYGKTIETELVKFEPEAMRAFVKYKLLKKVIAQCIDRRKVRNEKDPERESSSDMSPESVQEMDAKAMATFVEDVIEDVISVNQYYNKKFQTIVEEYDELSTIVSNDIQRKPRLFQRNRRDPEVLKRIYNLLGEMLLLQYFSSTNYNGIRKIIKKFRKVTKSTAVDNVMTIITNSSLHDVNAQNEMILQIQELYFLRLADMNTSSKRRGCAKTPLVSVEMLEIESKQLQDPESIAEVRENSMNDIIARNEAAPGKDTLRDMLFRGHRVLRSRIPLRLNDTHLDKELVEDSMQIQMAFYAIPAELLTNGEGEILDSREFILWEGYLLRRYSALNQWKLRYVIVSNKRLCIFDTQYGALKKNLLFVHVQSLYSGETYRFSTCAILITASNEAFWFASSDQIAYQQFLATVKDLFAYLVLDFFHGNHTLTHTPYYHTHNIENDSLYRSLNSQRDGTASTREGRTTRYASVTNLFSSAETLHIVSPKGSHSARELTMNSTQGESDRCQTVKESVPSSLHEGKWLPKLEETSKQIKSRSGEIMRLIYGISSELDIWFVLFELDEYLNQSWESSKSDQDDELLKREASKIIECIQESQATNAVFWTPLVTFFTITLFKWKYPSLATILQGKREFQPIDIAPTHVTITKLYRYERQIGDGHYSSVWIVESRQNHQFYALKKIPQYSLNKYERSALQKEVYNMILLRGHQGIVKIHGYFEDDYNLYIVMELAPGGRLFDYIKQRQQFTEGDAQIIVRALVGAVGYCHANGVVHRDLKPQNILLMDGQKLDSIKLTDFGFSSRMEHGALTTSLGTPGYTAPEVLRNQPYDSSVDMWSVGVITYILLCGYPPFASDNNVETLRSISKGEFQFYPKEWSSVSEDAKEFIRKLIVVDPSKRMTAEQCLEHPWLKNTSLATVNLTGVIQGMKSVKKFELHVATNRSIDKRQLRTHLCRCRVDVPVLVATDPSSTRIGVIPAGSPVDVTQEVWIDGIQYGYLTDGCCDYYKLQKGVCVIIQNENEMFCIHALTYLYKKDTEKQVDIYSSPLPDNRVIGQFTRMELVCDTEVHIGEVRWAIVHHMMYEPLRLYGIPQAWVILKDGQDEFFTRQPVDEEFKKRLEVYQASNES